MEHDEPGDMWAGVHSCRLVMQAEEKSSTVVMLIAWPCNPMPGSVDHDIKIDQCQCSAAWVHAALRPVWP